MGAPPPRHSLAHRIVADDEAGGDGATSLGICAGMRQMRHIPGQACADCQDGSRQDGSIAGGGGHVTGGWCAVRCVPGRFDSRLRAYLDRWKLALSFAVGRWHFRVVRHATRCARLWLALWRTAAIGRVGVEMGPEGRIRGSVASSNQKTNEAEGRRGRASNDGGRGEGRGDRRVYEPARSSSSFCCEWWEKS